MATIYNVSYNDIKKGDFFHPPPNNRMILIQIVDPCMDFPIPLCEHTFYEIHQFEFSDVDSPNDIVWPFRFRIEQAKKIIHILKTAKLNDADVIIHCIAGVSRSGAIVEFGIQELNFSDCNLYRHPNAYMLRILKNCFKYR
jgi:predicted protein tyrosine phosphatase